MDTQLSKSFNLTTQQLCSDALRCVKLSSFVNSRDACNVSYKNDTLFSEF